MFRKQTILIIERAFEKFNRMDNFYHLKRNHYHLPEIYLQKPVFCIYSKCPKDSKEFTMKIKIEIDEGLQEDEVLIRCRGLTDEVAQIQKSVSDVVNAGQKYVFYKGTTEYYLQLDDILFFQTEGDVIHAHTKDDIYETKYKLYQLEEMLPGFFMRISKSAILNTNHIYSISRNLTASSTVTFAGTHKQVFVSRYYYKPLISKLEEKRLHQ